MKTSRTTMAILYVNLFTAYLGIGLIIPIMPALMDELNLSGTTVGMLVATFAIFQFFCSPMAGRAADRWGRKWFIVAGLLLYAASQFMFGAAAQVWLLFVARALGGVSAAMIMPAVTAFLADLTSREERPKAMAGMTAALNTGFIIGPGIGGFLAEYGTRLPFFTAGAFSVAACLFSALLLREPAKHADESGQAPDTRQGLLRQARFLIPFLLIFLMSLGLAVFEGLLSLFLNHRFAYTPKDIAIAITGGAIIGVIFQVFLVGTLVKRIGEIGLTRISLVLSAVVAFLITIVNGYVSVMIVTFFLFIGVDLMRPAVTSHLTKIAGNRQGAVSGMDSMFTAFGHMTGPIVGGLLFDWHLNLPYYAAALIFSLGLVLALFWRNSRNDGNVRRKRQPFSQ